LQFAVIFTTDGRMAASDHDEIVKITVGYSEQAYRCFLLAELHFSDVRSQDTPRTPDTSLIFSDYTVYMKKKAVWLVT
jgi:hypothetical protein